MNKGESKKLIFVFFLFINLVQQCKSAELKRFKIRETNLIFQNSLSLSNTLNFKEGDYNGTFKFGGKYKNEIEITNRFKKILIHRAFSPPDDENLILKSNFQKKYKVIKFKKDNCFRNFFTEILKVIKDRKYDFYHRRMKHDMLFRINLNKKIT